jgi:hypothetical protein
VQAANRGSTYRDTHNSDSFEGLGITTDGIKALAKRSGQTEEQIMTFLTPALRATLAAQKAGGRFAKAKLAAGASEDGVEVLNTYVADMAHFISASTDGDRLSKAVETARGKADGQPALVTAINLFAQDRGTSNGPTARAFRRITSVAYLGVSVATAAANAATTYVSTPLTLGSIAAEAGGGYKAALSIYKRAAAAHAQAALHPVTSPDKLVPSSVKGAKREAMIKSANSGEFGGAAGDEAMADTGLGTKLAKFALIAHHRMEVGNRMATWSTAYDMAEGQPKTSKFWDALEARGYSGDKSSASAASFLTHNINVSMTRASDSAFGRSKAGAYVTPLLNYSLDMAQQEANLVIRAVSEGRAHPRVAAAQAVRLAALTTALGVRGTPMVGAIAGITKAVSALLALAGLKDDDEEPAVEEENKGLIRWSLNKLASGAPNSVREEIAAITRRMERGVSVDLPTGLPPSLQLPKAVYTGVTDAARKLKAGDTKGAYNDVVAAVPVVKRADALVNGETVGRGAQTLGERTKVAEKDITPGDRLLSAAGVSSEDESKASRAIAADKDNREDRTDPAKAIVNVFVDGDSKKAMSLLKDHNAEMIKEKNYGAVITGPQLKQAIIGEMLDRKGVMSPAWVKQGGKMGALQRMQIQKQLREEDGDK